MIQLIPGGFLKSVAEDTSPQLSGDLDGQSAHSLVNMVNADFSGVGGFGSLECIHADTHQFGSSDPVDHNLLENWEPDEHIDWTGTDEDLLTTGDLTAGEVLFVTGGDTPKVGIGTNTPGQLLEIKGGVDDAVVFRMRGDTNYTDIGIGSGVDGVLKVFGPTKAVLNLSAGGTAAKVFQIEQGEDHLQVIPGAAANIYYFEDSDGGETKVIRVYGKRSGGTKRYFNMAVGVEADQVASFKGDVIAFHFSKALGIATNSPSALLDINSDILRLRTAKTPASAGAAGNAGDICWDADYLYACVAANTWKRSAMVTW